MGHIANFVEGNIQLLGISALDALLQETHNLLGGESGLCEDNIGHCAQGCTQWMSREVV